MMGLLCRVILAQATLAPMTEEDVLRRAREANAKLPQASLEIQAADEKVRESRADRWMKVAIEGSFLYAPPGGYDPVVTNAGEARLQAVARQPLLDGGAHRAAIDRAMADREAAAARFRVAQKDLDVEIRSRLAELAAASAEISVRRAGIDRLSRYRTTLRSRKASGQGVAADLLKTDVRLASDEADAIEAESRAAEARAELNVLMARPPGEPLEISGGISSSPGSVAPGDSSLPEVAEAEALARGADADLQTARAERRLHLSASADAGWWGADTTRWGIDRWRKDAGFSFGLQVSLLLFDFGATDARIARAKLDGRRARLEIAARRREAELARAKAAATAGALRREIEVLSRAEPSARDSYLEAESRYRGGAAPALEVIDAYAAAVDASVKLAQARSRLRIAEALEERWGAP